ncbi:MAG: sialidase family protein [Bryobacteraceae bacterium]
MISKEFSIYLLGVVFAGAASPQSALPPAPGASIVNISSPASFSEPGVALNPKNPNQIAVVYQGGAAVQGGANAAYSNDAGRTFNIAQGTQPPDWRVEGDVSTTFDNKGNAFLCYLAFDRLGTAYYWAHDAGRNGIFVARSPDGGKTWEKNPIAVKAFPIGKEPNIQFEDEPRIFADNTPGSPYAGNLYGGWVEWQLDQSIMLFSRSTDAGKTWSAPIRISTHAGLPRDDNGSLGGLVLATAPDGTIYVIWDDGNTIAMTKSRDGGKSFARSRPIVDVGPPYFSDIPGVSRVEGFPQIAMDPRGGKGGGKLYICWSDYSNGDIDVFVASSSDHGRKWSKAVRVNDDPLHDGADQFYQWMAVDPITGAVYVQFYDRRADPAHRETRITLARSTDGGHTFVNYAWTDASFESGGAFLGDYTWMTAYNNHVYGAWTETERSERSNTGAANGASHSASPKTIIRFGSADFSR